MSHYSVLQIERSATADDIKKAYRRLTLLYHPDKNSGDKSTESFRQVKAAYEVLGDEKKRAHYDRGLETAFEFEFFRRRGRQQPQSPPPQLADIHITEEFTLEEIVAGGNKYFEYRKKVVCDICKGVNYTTCKICAGTGQMEIPAQGAIALKPGAKSGWELRVKGFGHTLVDGTIGDVVVKVKIVPHEIFTIVPEPEKLNLTMRQKIDIFDVLLKNEIEIHTLYGPRKVLISFKDIIYGSGMTAIKDAGLPNWHTQEKGDLLIEFEVTVPEKISAYTRKLIMKAKEKLKDDKSSD